MANMARMDLGDRELMWCLLMLTEITEELGKETKDGADNGQ